MNSNVKTDTKICTFWSESANKCHVCNDGLFIPLDEHIEAFCKSQDHCQCLQYSLHAPNKHSLKVHFPNKAANRRQYMRIATDNRIQLLKMIKSGEVLERMSEPARTLDISKIGMRLKTDIPLVHDSVLQFTFDGTSPYSSKSGTGIVEWCNKQIDAPGYEAGISFQTENIINAVDSWLKEEQRI